ncbi:MAG TPA: sigma-70 region 4 domain-containing protein [Armatimonadota bacterium]|nr:sigma-70 region 4 domain-containing protein [Armatimonadota bacterium]
MSDTSPEWLSIQREAVLSILDSLTPRQREAVLLRLDGLSQREIAQKMGISPRAVRRLVQRARRNVPLFALK